MLVQIVKHIKITPHLKDSDKQCEYTNQDGHAGPNSKVYNNDNSSLRKFQQKWKIYNLEKFKDLYKLFELLICSILFTYCSG